MEFDERLRKVVEAYNNRDKLVFTSEVVADFVNDLSDQIMKIMQDLKEDKTTMNQLLGHAVILKTFRGDKK